MTVVLVAVGGALGAGLRFLAGHVLDRGVHWGTLTVNLAGSFVLGVLVSRGVDETAMALFGTGFCGAFTTYSALAVQSVDRGGWRGLAYAVGTVVGCTALAWLGLQVGS